MVSFPPCPKCGGRVALVERLRRVSRNGKDAESSSQAWECLSGCPSGGDPGPFRFQTQEQMSANDARAALAWSEIHGEEFPPSTWAPPETR